MVITQRIDLLVAKAKHLGYEVRGVILGVDQAEEFRRILSDAVGAEVPFVDVEYKSLPVRQHVTVDGVVLHYGDMVGDGIAGSPTLPF